MGPKVAKASRTNGIWSKFRRTCRLSSWLLLQLLSQRKRMWRSDMRLQRCRWRSRPTWHNVLLSMVWVWDHQGVYHQPLRGLVVPWLRGNPALESERQIRSFTKWWRCDGPGFRLHESARVSTEAPQIHRYGWKSSESRRRPTATLKASLFRRSPHADIGTARMEPVAPARCCCGKKSGSVILNYCCYYYYYYYDCCCCCYETRSALLKQRLQLKRRWDAELSMTSGVEIRTLFPACLSPVQA